MIFQTFSSAIDYTRLQLKSNSSIVEAPHWQSIKLPKIGGAILENARMREVFDLYFRVDLRDQSLAEFAHDIKPNLPWADHAFEERVEGVPWNPGKAWETWPWASSAANFKKLGPFSHSYAERYWPKFAGHKLTDKDWRNNPELVDKVSPTEGLRYDYGDLEDVLTHLWKDPLSRQAYLPVWFPEDTGVVHGERVPCSIGYHFIQRDHRFHCSYFIRSCDYVRHFRDDLYMTLRLQLWVLDKLRATEPMWKNVHPGYLIFHCTSLHCFEQDYIKEFGKEHASETATQASRAHLRSF